MAIANDATSKNATASGTSLTLEHTVSGANRVLYVGVSTYKSEAPAIPTVTYNLVAMDQVSTLIYGGSDHERLTIFRLVNPDTGTNDIVVSVASAQEIVAVARSLTGVDQTDPDDTPVTYNTDAQTSASVNVSSATGDVVLDFIGIYTAGADLVEGASQTDVIQQDSVDDSNNAASSLEAGAATVTMSWTWTGGASRNPCLIALNLNTAYFPRHGFILHNDPGMV